MAGFGKVRNEKGHRVRSSSVIKGRHSLKMSKAMQGSTDRRSSYLKRTVDPSYFVTKKVVRVHKVAQTRTQKGASIRQSSSPKKAATGGQVRTGANLKG